MSATNERDQAISVLSNNLSKLSSLYRQCFDSMGKGALLVYTTNVVETKIPNEFDYRTKEEMLNIFPYGVLYSIEADQIYILAVMNLNKDPDYWKYRA